MGIEFRHVRRREPCRNAGALVSRNIIWDTTREADTWHPIAGWKWSHHKTDEIVESIIHTQEGAHKMPKSA